MNTESLINELKESPLFNLSLSSKELFHSNFLAWVCETYPIKFGEILCQHLDINEEASKRSILEVYREQRNIDLIIKLDSRRIIIENKVKSVPDKHQLIEYKKKNNCKDVFVLLTLIPPAFNPKEYGWNLISYSDLREMMSELNDSLNIDDKYRSHLLQDYIHFVYNLSKIIESLSFAPEKEFYDYYSSDFYLFKKIRLHDLYLKYKYSQIVTEIYNYLKSKLQGVIISKGVRYSHETHRNEIVISHNLINGKGVINIDYLKYDEITYGIMLDGVRYSHYMHSWGKAQQDRYKIANEFRLNNEWFKFDLIPESETYPKNGKDFNKFKDLIYRSFKISSVTQISVLLERIYKDTIKLMNINTNASNANE